jgi:hypothetical protein
MKVASHVLYVLAAPSRMGRPLTPPGKPRQTFAGQEPCESDRFFFIAVRSTAGAVLTPSKRPQGVDTVAA